MRAGLMIGFLTVGFAVSPAGGVATAADLAGSWSGGGYVTPKSGARERVSCRVTYGRQSAKVYSVSATCATTSLKFRQTGELLEVGNGRYVGDFYNPEYDVSGRVRVVLSGSRQTVTFGGASGGGSLSLSRR